MTQELAIVTLENEMDLILAHKRSMKLAELAGLSLSAQTTFATAVSEVARTSIGIGRSGSLSLNIENGPRDKFIIARLHDEQQNQSARNEGLEFAKKLVHKYNVTTSGAQTTIELFCAIAPSFKIDIHIIDVWRQIFRNEPPISPYEEIKRKNELLQELSDKVQKSEARYKTLTNALPLIIFTINNDGRIQYTNEWLEKFTGESVASLNTSGWERIIHPGDYDAFASLLQNLATTGITTIKTQVRLKNKVAGEYYWHQVSLTPYVNEQDDLVYRIGVIVDIHAQKVVEQTLQDNIELKEAQQMLKENQHILEKYIEELNRSNQELQQFAYIASHDLQEPVRKLLFYSDYLLQSNQHIDTRGVEYLKSLQKAAYRMRNLIHDILSFSQINKEKATFKKVNLEQLAKQAMQDLEMLIKEKHAVITVHSLPEVLGDELQLSQLFQNLLSNALKYAKKDLAPDIHIKALHQGQTVQVTFSDNGIGFDEKYLPQLFTLFQRLHKKEEYEGTGIGLAICKKIMDIHNGKIWAESEEGKGSVFHVLFSQV